MRLGTTILTKAHIVSDIPVKKTVHHPYGWGNLNRTIEKGMGARQIVIEGWAEFTGEKDSIEAACQVSGIKSLYFESGLGMTMEDRYYLVKTSAAVFSCENASVWYYAFTAVADDPAAYWVGSYLALINLAYYSTDLAVLDVG